MKLRNLTSILALLLGVLFSPFFFSMPLQPHFKLSVDMKVDKGAQIGFYLNNNYERFYSQPLKLNERTTYDFYDIPEKVETVRIDPINAKDGTVEIYKIIVSRNDKPLMEIMPGDLLKWGPFLNLTTPVVTDDHVVLKTTTDNPIFIGTMKYGISLSDSLILKMGSTISSVTMTFVWFCLIGIVLSGLFGRRVYEWRVFFPLLLVPLFLKAQRSLGIFLLSHLSRSLHTDQSIGIGSFVGAPKAVETQTYFALVLFSVAFAAGIFGLQKVLSGALKRIQLSEEPISMKSHKYSRYFLLILLTLLAVFGFPDIKVAFEKLPDTLHAPDWDSQAVLLWQYVYNMGLIPFKDYWFPYGGSWNEISPFPWDLVRVYFHNVIVSGVFISCIYKLTKFNKAWALITVISVLIFVEAGQMRGLYRYLVCVDIVILYLAITDKDKIPVWQAIVLGLFCGWATTFEVTQVFYASIPVAFVFLRRGLFGDIQFGKFLRSHVPGIVVLLVFLLAFAMKLYFMEQLSGFLSFYKNIGAMSVSSSTPGNMPGWTALSFQPENLVHVGTLILLMLGFYLQLQARKHKDLRISADFLVCFGLLASMIFLKHLVRPHMALQFIHVHWIALLLFLSQYADRWSRVQKNTALVACGGFLGWGFQSHIIPSVLDRYYAQAKDIPASVGILLLGTGRVKAQQNAFFAPELFTRGSPEVGEVYNYVKQARLLESMTADDLYVLGDSAFFYILFGRRPPPFVSVYDGGPLYAQLINLQWLKSHQPKILIWNSSMNSFDGVPNVVRVPLLYEYVIKNYSFQKKIGKFILMTRLPPGAKPDLGFWIENLGNEVDLGSIPSESHISDLPDCRSGDCYDDLEVTPWPGALGSVVSVRFLVGTSSFDVKFSTKGTAKKYDISLDRLWFWSVAKVAEIDVKIQAESKLIQSHQILRRSKDQILLY